MRKVLTVAAAAAGVTALGAVPASARNVRSDIGRSDLVNADQVSEGEHLPSKSYEHDDY
ncbi:hypothetical protein GCM10027447_21490 [Glycomyces halotolerans]